MRFLFDTNILINSLKKPLFFQAINDQFDFFDSGNELFISYVTVGELYSYALKNEWGEKRLNAAYEILKDFNAIPVANEDLMKAYAEIDVFSQGRHPKIPLLSSARKMSKNDLWIASTAFIFDAKLITTDKDFTHLNTTFIDVETIATP